MSNAREAENSADTSASSRSFLQQTTSQLLHQQEAMRRRREVLERNNRKPPAMRFGLSSPTRSRSPLPRTQSTSPPPPLPLPGPEAIDRSHALSHDPKKELPLPAPKQPMRFSLSYRPSPVPAAATSATRKSPTPPAPLEVNRVRASSASKALRRSKRSRSQRSASHTSATARQRARNERSRSLDGEPLSEEACRRSGIMPPEDIPVQILEPKGRRRSASDSHSTSAKNASPESKDVSELKDVEPRALHTEASPASVSEEKAEATMTASTISFAVDDSKLSPRRLTANEFPLPQFTPTHSALLRSSVQLTRPSTAAGAVTPVRPSFLGSVALSTPTPTNKNSGMGKNEFATPQNFRPTEQLSGRRVSHSGFPLPPAADSPQKEGQMAVADESEFAAARQRHPRPDLGDAQLPSQENGSTVNAEVAKVDGGVISEASPEPTATHVLASTEASAEKRRCHRPSPQKDALSSRHRSTSPAPAIDASKASKNTVLTASPDKRACGCDRPTPSKSPHQRALSRKETSAPATVAAAETMQAHHGETVAVDGALRIDTILPATSLDDAASPSLESAASPRLTAQNVVDSIAVSAEKKRARRPSREPEAVPVSGERLHSTTNEHGGSPVSVGVMSEKDCPCTSQGPRSRTPSDDAVPKRRGSPSLTPKHIVTSILRSTDQASPKENAVSRSHTGSATVASPIPDEREIAISTLTALKKHRQGRPTPLEERSNATDTTDAVPSGEASAVAKDSASPIPTTDQLMESLEVTADKFQNDRSGEPTVDRAEDLPEPLPSAREPQVSRLRTPSPVPTQDHIHSSVQASADKRKTQRAESSRTSAQSSHPPRESRVPVVHIASLVPPPSFPDGEATASSPRLTQQNIDLSMETLKEADTQLSTRSKAPEHPSCSTATELSPLLVSGTPLVSVSPSDNFASPEVTRENAVESIVVDAVAREAQAHRSSSQDRADTTRQDVQLNANTKEVYSSMAETVSVPPVTDGVQAGENEEGGKSVAPSVVAVKESSVLLSSTKITTASQLAKNFVADSPLSQDICADSVMFKECVSAGETPALPHLPPQFLALQKEVKAISEGRSRTGSRSPVPQLQRQAPQKVGLTEASSPQPPATVSAAVAARVVSQTAGKRQTEETRRSSLLLVDEASHPPFMTLIQEPHQPVPQPPPKTPPPVSVPRTPTPPPRWERAPSAHTDEEVSKRAAKPPRTEPHNTAQRVNEASAHIRPDSQYEADLSPLPRPVTLSSQFRVPSVPAASTSQDLGSVGVARDSAALGTQRVSNVPVQRKAQTGSALPLSLSPREGRSTPYPRDAALSLSNQLPETAEGTASSNRACAHAQGNIATESYDVHTAYATSREAVAVGVSAAHDASPTSSRAPADGSAPSPNSGHPRHTADREDPTVTKAPSSPSSSQRDSTGSRVSGRKSSAELLLEDLPRGSRELLDQMDGSLNSPDDAIATCLSGVSLSPAHGETEGDKSPAGRASASILSDISESGSGSISQRVSSRVRQSRYSYADYAAYLEAITRSSAKKARKVSAKRMHQKVVKDVLTGEKKPSSRTSDDARRSDSTDVASGNAVSRKRTASPPGKRARHEDSVQRTPSLAGDECVEVSPLTPESQRSVPTPARATSGRHLSVTTRLSTELKEAIFRLDETASSARGAASAGNPESLHQQKKKKKKSMKLKRSRPVSPASPRVPAAGTKSSAEDSAEGGKRPLSTLAKASQSGTGGQSSKASSGGQQKLQNSSVQSSLQQAKKGKKKKDLTKKANMKQKHPVAVSTTEAAVAKVAQDALRKTREKAKRMSAKKTGKKKTNGATHAAKN